MPKSEEIYLYRNYNNDDDIYVGVDQESLPSINYIISLSGSNTYDWSRENYNFIGWNTSRDGTGIFYYPGDFCSEAEVFAIWEELPESRQPVLTYNLTWGSNNSAQKLSGKTYVNPSGQTVDCSYVTVTFSSSKHFKKFYATAVKSGNSYGFIDDVLVDIRDSNPTGVLLYELTERNANANFSFAIQANSLTKGQGTYRIGLYVQSDDNIWNYEYFLISTDNKNLETNTNLSLQAFVQTEGNSYGFTTNGNNLTITNNNSLVNDTFINNNDYLYVGWAFDGDDYETYDEIIFSQPDGAVDFRNFDNMLAGRGHDGGLCIQLSDNNNTYNVLLSRYKDSIQWMILNIDGNDVYFPVIPKNVLTNGTSLYLTNYDFYAICYYPTNTEKVQIDDSPPTLAEDFFNATPEPISSYSYTIQPITSSQFTYDGNEPV